MTSSCNELSDGFSGVVFKTLISIPVWKVNNILFAVIMSNTLPVIHADVNHIILAFKKNVISTNSHGIRNVLNRFSVTDTAVSFNNLLKPSLVNHRECGLLYIEQCSYFSASVTFVVFFTFIVQFQICAS